MIKWIYASRYLKGDGEMRGMNEMGTDGWELICIIEGWYYFKRPIKE